MTETCEYCGQPLRFNDREWESLVTGLEFCDIGFDLDLSVRHKVADNS